MSQKGFLSLFLVGVVVVALMAGGLIFYSISAIKKPAQNLQNSSNAINQALDEGSSSVALKKEYQNPFDKASNYSNPFNEYQNPFNNLK